LSFALFFLDFAIRSVFTPRSSPPITQIEKLYLKRASA
jgi:hypothetical protein